MICPSCSAENSTPATLGSARFIHHCRSCGCYYGSMYKGDSYSVLKGFSTNPADDSRAVPYNFEILGSRGVEHQHGWFVPTTGLITQIG